MSILDIITNTGFYFCSFILIVSLITFIHEFGHYFFARLCKVRVETFSLGFGKEIFGFTDRKDTRWKFSLIPAGGYVKMYGDEITESSSAQDSDSFQSKNLLQKACIVSGGPFANLLSAIIILTLLFTVYGKSYTQPIITKVALHSTAEKAGLQVNDRITFINDAKISTFEDIVKIVSLNTENVLDIQYLRDGIIHHTTLQPRLADSRDIFGNKVKVSQIGIASNYVKHEKLNIVNATNTAIIETFSIIKSTYTALKQIITGQRSIKELSGPIKIAKYSGQSLVRGIWVVLWFIAMLSINLAFINLLPIPALDGGYLMYYLLETINGKPLALKYQEYGVKLGTMLLIGLFILVAFNDIRSIIQ